MDFWELMNQRKVRLVPSEWGDPEDYDKDDFEYEDIYLHIVKYNKGIKQYEITTEIWQNPVGREYLEFTNGKKYKIDDLGIVICGEIIFATRENFDDEQLWLWISSALSVHVYKQCEEIKADAQKQCDRLNALVDVGMVRKSPAERKL